MVNDQFFLSEFMSNHSISAIMVGCGCGLQAPATVSALKSHVGIENPPNNTLISQPRARLNRNHGPLFNHHVFSC